MPTGEVIVKVRSLKKHFEIKRGFLSMGGEAPVVKAVDDVNMDLRQGEILGLVGESGCGKTTMGRLLTRLEDPTDGEVFFLGRDIALLEGSDIRIFRRNIQMVFQDPYESLNPRTTVLQTIMEPLVNHKIGDSSEERIEMSIQALEDAGLAPAKEYLNRFPHELSGGQRQRVSIARALVIKPKVIVADEPVSMLDVSIRAGVLNLMLDLRDKYGIPYLFITHDIAVARYVSDRLGVMYLGRVVELADTDNVVFQSKHPYTQALLSAVPVPDPEAKHGRVQIKGEIPSAANVPLGCRFRPRCPRAFVGCGWQGEDLAEWLREQGVLAEDHPASRMIDKLLPDEFALEIHLKKEASPEDALLLLKEEIAKLKDGQPMYDAIQNIGVVMGDQTLEIECGAARLAARDLAKELFDMLESAVRYDEVDDPMHGIITDIRVAEDRLSVSVGGTGREPVEATEAFLKDFVRHNRRKRRPELRGVRRISADYEARVITITCGSAVEPAKRIARKVAEAIAKNHHTDAGEDIRRLIMPTKVKGAKVLVRVIGPADNWPRVKQLLESFFKARAEEERWAKAVKGVNLKTAKRPGALVVAKFITVDEPPLYDVGGGHRVACYLFKQTAK